ncbi:MAG TPA: molybdate ABC transporter substrate-binding protein [Vicinamibacteria bacterium]|nr:molybdate ABC transporter substrate-binding protein [Vicinamibacteria bacterium]
MRARTAPAAALLAALAATAAPASAPVRVFAAASLGEALRELAAELEPGGLGTELNLAGTQVLRTQIEQGAPAEVYAFADVEDARVLQRRGLVQAPAVFARNALCVVTPAARPRVRALADLAGPGVKVVLAAPAVPAGRYAARVLERLEAGGLGAGYRGRVLANVVSQETSVRLVLARVALGEADAGFVYVSDAHGEPRVAALTIPAAANVVAEYGIGLVSPRPRAEARAFVQAVLGPAGRRILAARGFALP